MAVTKYDIITGQNIADLKAKVTAAQDVLPLGEVFLRGGYPGQVVVTGTPVVGYISGAYNIVAASTSVELVEKVIAVISDTQQPIGEPVVRGSVLIQVLATITAADAGESSVTSADITDATTIGKALITAANTAAGRSALGASAIGSGVFVAADAAAARSALGAGTSSLALGTTATTAMAGNTFVQGAAVADVASGADAAALVTSVNALLASLRTAKIIASA